jgi:hypothetical protein
MPSTSGFDGHHESHESRGERVGTINSRFLQWLIVNLERHIDTNIIITTATIIIIIIIVIIVVDFSGRKCSSPVHDEGCDNQVPSTSCELALRTGKCGTQIASYCARSHLHIVMASWTGLGW